MNELKQIKAVSRADTKGPKGDCENVGRKAQGDTRAAGESGECGKESSTRAEHAPWRKENLKMNYHFAFADFVPTAAQQTPGKEDAA